MAITPRFHPSVQVLKIFFQVLPVLLLRDSIHADCRTLSGATVGSLQSWNINQVCQ
jgi:hypothetical protein